jgi:hypothetical protein
MGQYIDKDEVVEELKKRRSKNARNKLNLAASFEDNYLLSFLDTLKTKEVNFEVELRNYVSFEMARLLKEKGFDEPCFGAYTETNHNITMFNGKIRNSEVGDLTYAAPTLYNVMEWLKKYNKEDV